MHIVNHEIQGISKEKFATRGALSNVKYIVIHYTAGGNLSGSISYLKSKNFGYHILVDRDGKLIQGAPFNKRVSHAGCSNWLNDKNFNQNSIGICAANYGYFDMKADNMFFRSDIGNISFSKEKVIIKKHYSGNKKFAWEKYKAEQYDAIYNVCKALKEKYPTIENIIGHDEIALGRKLDPGPAFDYSKLYQLFPNRDDTIVKSKYKVNSPDGILELRRGRSRNHLKIKSLKNGDVVYLRSKEHFFKEKSGCYLGKWASVSLSKDLIHDGFVYWKYLEKA